MLFFVSGSLVRLKRLLNILAVVFALAVGGLAVRHFVVHGWPIHHANVWLVLLATGIFLAAYAFKAWGWQRLFRRERRPAMVTLAAAGGAASMGGIALPGRFDELLRIAVVRRCRRPRASIGAVAFSLVVLGLIDSAALTPLASVAAGVTNVSGVGRAALIGVAAVGVAAAGLVLALPRLVRLRRLARFRVSGWASEHAAPPRDAVTAWAAVAVSWTLRGLALFVLLGALGLPTSFALALAFLCASSASAVLPIAPAGAITQAGAGAAILVASGMHPDEAIAFGVAAQGLVIAAGAICVAAMAAWHAHGRVRPLLVR
jgi:uncharacterized membrane protein YbhN (UPF0104 family)